MSPFYNRPPMGLEEMATFGTSWLDTNSGAEGEGLLVINLFLEVYDI